MSATLMLVGLGGLGRITLELLARDPRVGRIVVTTRDERRGVAARNLATLGAMAQGVSPRIELVQLDLDDGAAIVDVVGRVRPDVIYTTATRRSWWIRDRLSPRDAAPIERAGFGVWLPVHLALTVRLMRALREARFAGHVVTAPYPDVANCVLGAMGLAPSCGVGNLDEIVPKIRLLAAGRLDVPVATIDVMLVAHHALEDDVFRSPGDHVRDPPPYHLRIEHDGRDVTAEVDGDALLLQPFPMPSGPATHFLTAGSSVRLLRSLLGARETLMHAPGPDGLPGGYPVAVSRSGVRVRDVPGLDRSEAVAINSRSHRFDGIDRIELDGTVVFLDAAAGVMADVLGYHCRRLPPADLDGRARELLARFDEYARVHSR